MFQAIINWFKSLLEPQQEANPAPVIPIVPLPVQPLPPVPHPEPAPETAEQATGYRLTVLNRWQKARVLDAQKPVLASLALKALSYKEAYYDPVQAAIGIPWYVVAAIDMREESFNHTGYLGNGDPWNKKSVHVPAGRGPFTSWYAGAIDALKLRGLEKVGHWDIVTSLIHLEAYNGLGYKSKGVASPYVWAKTNLQVAGKYVSDGSYSSTTWDQQPGCAALILTFRDVHSVDVGEA